MASRVRWLGAKDKADILVRAYGYPDTLNGVRWLSGPSTLSGPEQDVLNQFVNTAIPANPSLSDMQIAGVNPYDLSQQATDAFGRYADTAKRTANAIQDIANKYKQGGDIREALKDELSGLAATAATTALTPVLGPAALVAGPVVGALTNAVFGGIFGHATDYSAVQARVRDLNKSSAASVNAWLQSREDFLVKLSVTEENIRRSAVYAAASVFAQANEIPNCPAVVPYGDQGSNWTSNMSNDYVGLASSIAGTLFPNRTLSDDDKNNIFTPQFANEYNSSIKQENDLPYYEEVKNRVDKNIFDKVLASSKGAEFRALHAQYFAPLEKEQYKFFKPAKLENWFENNPPNTFQGQELLSSYDPVSGTSITCFVPDEVKKELESSRQTRYSWPFPKNGVVGPCSNKQKGPGCTRQTIPALERQLACSRMNSADLSSDDSDKVVGGIPLSEAPFAFSRAVMKANAGMAAFSNASCQASEDAAEANSIAERNASAIATQLPTALQIQMKHRVTAPADAHLTAFKAAIANKLRDFTKDQLQQKIIRDRAKTVYLDVLKLLKNFKYGDTITVVELASTLDRVDTTTLSNLIGKLPGYSTAADLRKDIDAKAFGENSALLNVFHAFLAGRELTGGKLGKSVNRSVVNKPSPSTEQKIQGLSTTRTGTCGVNGQGLTEAEKLIWKASGKLCDKSAAAQQASQEWTDSYNRWVQRNSPKTAAPAAKFVKFGLSGPAPDLSSDAYAKQILLGKESPPMNWSAPSLDVVAKPSADVGGGGGGGSASDNTPMLLLGLGVVAALGYFLMKDKKG